ncbi:hypothetical protein ES703_103260 [subsurface metagenome]
MNPDESFASVELFQVVPFELIPFKLLPGKSLYYANAGQILLQRSGQLGFLLLIGFVGTGDTLVEVGRYEQQYRDHGHRDQRQAPVQYQDTPQTDGLIGKEAPQCFYIAGGALNELSGLRPVVEGEG